MKLSRINNHIVIHILLLILFCSVCSIHAQDMNHLVSRCLQFAEEQLANTVYEMGDAANFPKSTLSDGSWKTRDSGSWTSGFFPGCLWYMYEKTLDDTWKMWAEKWTAGMENEKYYTIGHDVGFMIFCSFGNGYRITEDETYRNVIILAATSLATRFNPTVGCIKSLHSGPKGQYPVIIDNMMNLELLFWASKQSDGKQEWYDMAVSHSLKTIENHVRSDGSTYHLVDYDPNTGKVIKRNTIQGYSDESTWARGQAWGLYGFTMTYRETGDSLFLETAKKIADYFINNLPEDYVPYWDFQAPNIPNEYKEASAASIAASGLLELSTLVSNTEDRERYWKAASNILVSLASAAYLAEGTKSHGILLHSNGNVNKNSEVDVSMIYSDYYFIEALLRYQNGVYPMAVSDYDNFSVPASFQLFQNYPNPFNPETTIMYYLPFSTNMMLNVYDLNGQLVQTLKNDFEERGEHRYRFNGKKLSTGTYLIVLRAGDQLRSQKLTLIR